MNLPSSESTTGSNQSQPTFINIVNDPTQPTVIDFVTTVPPSPFSFVVSRSLREPLYYHWMTNKEEKRATQPLTLMGVTQPIPVEILNTVANNDLINLGILTPVVLQPAGLESDKLNPTGTQSTSSNPTTLLIHNLEKVDVCFPIPVNRKQYTRIVKRRVQRAKEAERFGGDGKRRQYMYESRHMHAMQQQRALRGRFAGSGIAKPVCNENV